MKSKLRNICVIAMLTMIAAIMVYITYILSNPSTSQSTMVSTIELSKLTFGDQQSGIKVPLQYGDFSITHSMDTIPYKNRVFVNFLPKSGDNPYIYCIWLRRYCPEIVAMYRCNMDAEFSDYWIYDRAGHPRQVTEAYYDAHINNEEIWKCQKEE